MDNRFDSEHLNIPAFLRNKAIVKQSKQKLILTALDRKEAGLSVHSKKAVAPVRKKYLSKTPRKMSGSTSSYVQKLENQATARQNLFGQQQTPYRQSQYRNNLNNQNQRTIGQMQSDFVETSRRELIDQFEHQPKVELQNEYEEEQQQQSIPTSQKWQQVGVTTHYIDKIQVAIILLSGSIKLNDILVIEGENFIATQLVSEIQIDRNPVKKATSGDHIGLKVEEPALVNGKVYKAVF